MQCSGDVFGKEDVPSKGEQLAACMSSQPVLLCRLGFGGFLAFHLVQAVEEKNKLSGFL